MTLPSETPPQIQQANLQEVGYTGSAAPETLLVDPVALAKVVQTFTAFESHRTTYVEPMWEAGLRAYHSYRPAQVWKGTKTPRANLGGTLVFEKIETALPKLQEALFGSTNWFSVTENNRDPKAAAAVEARLRFIMSRSRGSYGTPVDCEFQEMLQFMLMYGLGGVGLRWNPATKCPTIEAVDPRNFYFDPATRTFDVDAMSCVIERRMVSVQDLIAMRSTPNMNIPPDEQLRALGGGLTARSTQLFRNEAALVGALDPTENAISPQPDHKQLEVLIYWSKTEVIWVLNRQLVLFAQPNDYGFIPYAFTPCYKVPGQALATSMASRLSTLQRYQEALVNARLDTISMTLQPPKVRTQGKKEPMLWGPNEVIDNVAGAAKDGVALLQIADSTAQAYQDVDRIGLQSDRVSGVPPIDQSQPQPGTINRTAQGVNSQQLAGTTRLRTLVTNVENGILLPTLLKLSLIDRFHAQKDEMVYAYLLSGEVVQMPAGDMYGDVSFTVNCSSKMVRKERLQQFSQFWIQNVTGLMAPLAETGRTIDWEETLRLLMDANGVDEQYALVRKLTPEEQQARMQEQQAAQQAQAQQAQAADQTRLQIAGQKNEAAMAVAQTKAQADVTKAQIAKSPDPMEEERERIKTEMAVYRDQMKAELEREKAAIQMEVEQLKLQAAREKNAIQGEQALQKLIFGQQEAQVKLESSATMAQEKARQSQESHELKQEQEKQRFKMEPALKTKDKKSKPLGGESPRWYRGKK